MLTTRKFSLKNVPPPPSPIHSRTNYEQQMKEAEQLAELAISVLSRTEQTNSPAEPKALTHDLHRIEKLARKLRSELAQ